MRTRVTFDVHGSTLEELERRAYERLAEFLQSTSEDAKSRSDLEIDVEEGEPVGSDSYVGHVFAKVRQ